MNFYYEDEARAIQENEYGKDLVFEGKTYRLAQEAFIDGPADERPYYKALAVDKDGKEYMIIWDVKDNWEAIAEQGDEGDMCEWDSPASVTRL